MAIETERTGAYDAVVPVTLPSGQTVYARATSPVDASGAPLGTAANPIRTQSAAGTGTAANQVQGTSASSAADDGSNPVKVGGRVTTTGMTYTDGQRADIQMDANGGIATYLKVPATNTPIAAPVAPPDNESVNRYGLTVYGRAQVFNGAGWDKQRGDTTGIWVHGPASTASSSLSGSIATSGGTAAITMTNTTRSEVINPSTATLWASWGTPAVNGAGSFPIIAGGSYNVPDRAAGTLTLLSTAATQPYTVNRFS